MKPRARLFALAPLALALTALAVRQSTRPTTPHLERRGTPREFVPPALFLAASRSPQVAHSYVPAQSSRVALVQPGRGVARIESACTVTGQVSIDALDAGLQLVLRIEPSGAAHAAAPIELRATATDCRPTPIPGTHGGTLTVDWIRGDTRHSTSAGVTWMRLPAANLRMQAVLDLEGDPTGDATRARARASRPRTLLALDLLLER